MNPLDQKIAQLEALLFLNGEPLSHARIATTLGVEIAECESLIAELENRLDDGARGLHLVSDKDKIQLATKPEFGNILEDFVKEELTEELSPASLESLAIIAYLGPISRARIEYLRGVNSSVILRSLQLRGLIERLPDPEHASSFLYRTTFEFMRHIGVNANDQMLEYAKFKDLVKVFEEKKEEK